jgi:hypothetical protein
MPDRLKPGEALERERCTGEWLDGQTQEEQWVVVASGPVQVELMASEATMDQYPLAVAADGDGDGLHG